MTREILLKLFLGAALGLNFVIIALSRDDAQVRRYPTDASSSSKLVMVWGLSKKPTTLGRCRSDEASPA